MRPFEFKSAHSPQEAMDHFATSPTVMYLAGGTTMVDLMKLNVLEPETLVYLDVGKRAPVARSNDSMVVDAHAKMSDVAEHPLITEHFPMISESLLLSASPQIRNMATIGGNLLQRTRCSYFRDPSLRCNKRNPGSGCDAIGGSDRMMAVLGISERCIATHPSDLAVALVALEAVVRTRNASGSRSIPIRDFYIAYGDDPSAENVLQDGELIEFVELPMTVAGKNSLYLKIRDRASYEFALASAAVALEVDGGKIRVAKIALGGVGTKPWAIPEIEVALVNQPATRETFEHSATEALKNAKPLESNGFKVELCKRTLVRALEYAARGQHPKWYEH